MLYARTLNLASAGGNTKSLGRAFAEARVDTTGVERAATYRRLTHFLASICKPINFNQQQQQQPTQLGGLRVLGLNNRSFIATDGGQTLQKPVQPIAEDILYGCRGGRRG